MLRHALGLLALLAAAPAFADEVKPFADTSRLVAIGGSLTEIVYALGEENRLVARDSTALYPEAALQLPDGDAEVLRLALVSVALSLGALVVSELLARRSGRGMHVL